MGKTSRTHTADARRAAAMGEALPVAWASVRELYPARIRAKVDSLAERGGITLRDLGAMTTAQLLMDLADQKAGGESSRQISAHLRLLFRLAMVSGGAGDAATALVQVPPEVLEMQMDPEDLGDDVMD